MERDRPATGGSRPIPAPATPRAPIPATCSFYQFATAYARSSLANHTSPRHEHPQRHASRVYRPVGQRPQHVTTSLARARRGARARAPRSAWPSHSSTSGRAATKRLPHRAPCVPARRIHACRPAKRHSRAPTLRPRRPPQPLVDCPAPRPGGRASSWQSRRLLMSGDITMPRRRFQVVQACRWTVLLHGAPWLRRRDRPARHCAGKRPRFSDRRTDSPHGADENAFVLNLAARGVQITRSRGHDPRRPVVAEAAGGLPDAVGRTSLSSNTLQSSMRSQGRRPPAAAEAGLRESLGRARIRATLKSPQSSLGGGPSRSTLISGCVGSPLSLRHHDPPPPTATSVASVSFHDEEDDACACQFEWEIAPRGLRRLLMGRPASRPWSRASAVAAAPGAPAPPQRQPWSRSPRSGRRPGWCPPTCARRPSRWMAPPVAPAGRSTATSGERVASAGQVTACGHVRIVGADRRRRSRWQRGHVGNRLVPAERVGVPPVDRVKAQPAAAAVAAPTCGSAGPA